MNTIYGHEVASLRQVVSNPLSPIEEVCARSGLWGLLAFAFVVFFLVFALAMPRYFRFRNQRPVYLRSLFYIYILVTMTFAVLQAFEFISLPSFLGVGPKSRTITVLVEATDFLSHVLYIACHTHLMLLSCIVALSIFFFLAYLFVVIFVVALCIHLLVYDDVKNNDNNLRQLHAHDWRPFLATSEVAILTLHLLFFIIYVLNTISSHYYFPRSKSEENCTFPSFLRSGPVSGSLQRAPSEFLPDAMSETEKCSAVTTVSLTFLLGSSNDSLSFRTSCASLPLTDLVSFSELQDPSYTLILSTDTSLEANVPWIPAFHSIIDEKYTSFQNAKPELWPNECNRCQSSIKPVQFFTALRSEQVKKATELGENRSFQYSFPTRQLRKSSPSQLAYFVRRTREIERDFASTSLKLKVIVIFLQLALISKICFLLIDLLTKDDISPMTRPIWLSHSVFCLVISFCAAWQRFHYTEEEQTTS